MNPKVSVVMPVYNTEAYVAEAIESILQQTWGDFEFIIVDDGSTDNSLKILQDYQQRDQRIKIIRNQKNAGLGICLQKAVEIAAGEFIARMDADDISTPDRFEKQIRFMDTHPDIGILGGDHWIINNLGIIIGELQYPAFASITRWNMLLGNGLVVSHSATMIQKKILKEIGGYGPHRAGQDFDLWSRTFDTQPLPIANLNEKILYYRRHSQTNTEKLRATQEAVAVSTRRSTIEKLLGEPITENVILAYRHTGQDYPDLGRLMQTWIKIYDRFLKRFDPGIEERDYIKREITQRLSHYIYMNPFITQKRGRIFFLRCLKWMTPEFSKEVLTYKLQTKKMRKAG